MNERILIVDDDPVFRATLHDLLAMQGYEPFSCSDGAAACLLAREMQINLSLIDLQLEDMSGLDVIRCLRQEDDHECILLTGHASQASAIEAINLGTFSYLVKPFDLDQLLVTIRRALEHQETRRRLQDSEASYRSLFDGVPVGIYRASATGEILDANPVFVALLGYTGLEELIANTTCSGYRAICDLEQWQRSIAQNGLVRGFESQWRRADGSLIWVRETSRAYRNGGGQVLYYEGAVEDITEQKRLELAAEQKERERQQAEAMLQKRVDQLAMLNDISAKITAATGLETCLETAVRLMQEKFGFHHVAVFTIDQARSELVMRAKAGRYAHLYPPDHRLKLAQGMVGWVGLHGQSLLANDINAEPRYVNLYPGIVPTQAELAVPIRTGVELLGVLDLQSPQLQAFDESDVQVSETLAAQLAIAIENLRLYEAARQELAARKLAEEQTLRQLQHLGALHAIDLAITASFDLRLTLNVLLDQLTSQLGVDAVDILLYNPHSHTLEYAAGRGFRTQALQFTRLHLGQGHAGRVALERKLICVDLTSEEREFKRAPLLAGERFVTYCGLPLVAKGQLKGVVEIFLRNHTNPEGEWLMFLESLATQAAIAIDNATLFDNLQRSNEDLMIAYEATIEGWSKALEMRDPTSQGHTLRVTELTLQLARRLGLSDADLVHVRRGALLHDIGMLAIPDQILLKPGPLSAEEWQVVRLHPLMGRDLLLPIEQLRRAVDIPYCHHEKWDGGEASGIPGYPQGLRGERIPLPARIFALVDAWDALRSVRAYRPAWTDAKALEYIQSQSGRQFDPRVVDTFLAALQELPHPPLRA
jgi:PAS domain S-box-containing protein